MLRPNLAPPPPTTTTNNELSVCPTQRRSPFPPARPTAAIERIRNAIILFGQGHRNSQHNLARVRPQLQLGGDAANLPILNYESRDFHFLLLLFYLWFPVHCRRLNHKGMDKDGNPFQNSKFCFMCRIDATNHGKDGAARNSVCLMIHLPPPS